MGGLALGLVAAAWLGRALLKEKDEHRESWKKLGSLAETYAELIKGLNEKKAAREIRLAQKAEAVARRKGGAEETGRGDPNGGTGEGSGGT